ncbi:DNA-binding protein [Sulfolobus sp. E5-1-F]|uniref:NOB1 family endonuclease n=1 Tax=Sulfolobaceae TaxID=118883 RepID=UPI001296DB16|nr:MULTISPECIES: NOB1 family endonuclease [unclassified Sulfolobus]QGA53387.1 DNA-binding protein [Sulfolobus sp. E5-1-F]QGA68492.1 DNA-binding protein [Sulfolobus sp. E11-6]
MHIIFDTSAFLAGLQLSLDKIYTTQEVINEVKDRYSRFNLEIAISSGKVIIMKPSPKSLEKVIKVLNITRERKLSNTDISIIALALDLQPSVVLTDDLSVQNTLKHLGIQFSSVKINKKVEKSFKFKYICIDCKREFNIDHRECPYCGGKVVKRKIME